MTPLPQRKKTAEEIAQLRDQLGVPPSVDSSSSMPPAQPTPELSPEPAPSSSADFESALEPNEDFSLPPKDFSLPPTQDFGFTKVISREERMAEEQHSKLPAKLPAQRHSPEELEEMQRREMLKQLNTPPPPNLKFMAAHPLLIGLGYLLATVGACSFWITKFSWPAVAGCSATALLIAGFVALRRPVSRHHAGFISALSVLVGVFTTIHHFNQLQHAS